MSPAHCRKSRAKKASPRAHLHQVERVGSVEHVPHLNDLTRDYAGEQRPHVGAGEEVAAFPGDALPTLSVVAVLGVIETPVHVFAEGDAATAPKLVGEELSEA